jgi:hypothetical protein
MTSTVPPKVREAVLLELVRQLDEVRWEELGSSDTSAWYTRFVRDENIGRRLSVYMSDVEIRVWIKDGPAKEYRRALEGRGSYAQYTSRAFPGPEIIVRGALGNGWSLIADSVEEKPMRCLAKSGDQMKFLIWGPTKSLKDLVWQATVTLAENPQTAITLVITRSSATRLTGDSWSLAERLSNVIGVDCKQVTYAVSKKTSLRDVGSDSSS